MHRKDKKGCHLHTGGARKKIHVIQFRLVVLSPAGSYPSPQAWPGGEPCSSALRALPQRSVPCQDAQASYQLPFSVDKSPQACRYEEGQMEVFPLALCPPDLKDMFVFCPENKANPVLLWNVEEIRRKAGRVRGKQNEKGF